MFQCLKMFLKSISTNFFIWLHFFWTVLQYSFAANGVFFFLFEGKKLCQCSVNDNNCKEAIPAIVKYLFGSLKIIIHVWKLYFIINFVNECNIWGRTTNHKHELNFMLGPNVIDNVNKSILWHRFIFRSFADILIANNELSENVWFEDDNSLDKHNAWHSNH